MCTIFACDPTWSDCDALVATGCETNLQVDPDNCSACKLECEPGEQCEVGECGVFCEPGKANCDGSALNGCEVSLGTNNHCGFCGDSCDLSNATGDCQAGVCAVIACAAGFDDCDGVAENGCEVDLETSAADCGACNFACPSGPNSTAVCSTGTCSLVCAGGFENCNADPTDGCEQPTLTDTSNCGGCNSVCVVPNGTPGCSAGVCQITTCNPGFANCDLAVPNGCEVNLNSDIDHCGSCPNACPTPANAGATCTGGSCGFTCNVDFADCDGQPANGCEVNLQTDPTHCGSCAGACNLGQATPVCNAGACAVGSCNAGFGNCDGLAANGCEINFQTDPLHCGSCAGVCSLANSTQSCVAGACAVGTCNLPFADCDGQAANGCETNTDSSIPNCGACGQACAVANGSPACAAGQCLVASCNAGSANCDNLVANGCEVNTQTDVANCGSCGGLCDLPNAGEACTNGVCAVATCTSPFANCDNQAANGCETNLDTTPTSCGACGDVCNLANATEGCAAAACTIASCDVGFGNCDALTANGCETNLNTTAANCGSCGNVCNLANATEVCTSGACAVASCNAGFGNCDNLAGNGCETNLNTAVASCGACGNVCNLPNAVEGCAAGACTVVSCNAGFGDCDGQAANGCETNLNASLGNCGTCGNVCNLANAAEVCNNGACAVATCDAGFGNCDNQAANGCETNLNTTVASCGSCGNACNLANASQSCVNGACAVGACNAGFDNCDNLAANGCETNLHSTVTGCGACGNVCSLANATEACASGACAVGSCNAGFGDCDNQAANGCEINTNSNVSNCGTCGTVCSFANAAASCTNAACAMGTCDAGFGNCDNQAANGCEINTNTNVSNCGACGNVCTLPNAAEVCTAGACAVATCEAPFANCNNLPADGCEINLTNNALNCGGCGNVCNLPNAVPLCAAGMCGIASCLPGFADCDGNVANGCEVNTQTSVGNCGACGSVCSPANATGVCSSGTCQVGSCNAGFSNCNGLPIDGCEINTNTSVANCGGCGQICAPANSAGLCSSGSCVIGSCNSGFSNCNGSQADGCEINTTSDVQNCGTCGNNCAVSCAGNTSLTQCSTGTCQIQSCQTGFHNVDGLCSGGCECQASNVSQSCPAPTSLGVVNVGQTLTTSANLVPNGVVAWYTVTFTGNTNPNYHPRVRLTANPGSAFQFDIRTNCSGGAISCGVEGGVSSAVTDWETFFANGPGGYYDVIPPVGNNGTILIRVFRKSGQPLTCGQFTLQVSN